MKKKTDGLLFRIGLMFAVITIITLVMCGISTYYIQMKMYKDQCEVNVKSLAYYLEDLAEQDGEAFVAYTKFMTEYWNEVKVPLDFSDYSQAQEEFEKTFSEKYPGHHLGKDDIDYYDMSKDLKLLYTRGKHEYWTLVHEKAREDFNLPYTEYVVPTGEEGHIYFVVDSMRDPSEVFGDDYLNICINIENKAEDNHEHLWAA